MSTTAGAYLQALLALSGKPHLSNARHNLLRDVSDRDLLDLILQATGGNFPREGLEHAVLRMLDAMDRNGTMTGQIDEISGLLHDPKHVERQSNTGTVQGKINILFYRQTVSDFSADLIDFSDVTSLTLSVEHLTINDRSENYAQLDEPTTSSSDLVRIPAEVTQVYQQHIHASEQAKDEISAPIQNIKIDENDLPEDEQLRLIYSSNVQKKSKSSARTAGELTVPMDNIVLWCPTIDNAGTWVFLDKATQQLQTQVKTRFEADFLAKLYLHKKLGQLLRNLGAHLTHGYCVSKRLSASQRRGACEYTRAEGNNKRACDFCIKMHRLCLKPAMLDGAMRLALYPLPSSFRGAETWEDIGFWLQK
ncbi:hypothetical protein IAQ61_002528 [Plenodomus lingam]|uniref:Predicted protein n=1 Tax=Leptosphaeria maculans (strain JN3 / isolate v23.1.3 / race Av1-4-5-6-7-8) TaxID=985895 RepID=E4ZIP1_LEPMJ|nr:predicted protein [Plenodomus lingam JN3]KAH9877165.1 hypothetical protein IAQ61_002528 [Plenodomus lingam]CBX91062.1 predicted protein [Plenodomus lingam JN3]